MRGMRDSGLEWWGKGDISLLGGRMRPELFILLSILSMAPKAARDLPAQKVWTDPDVEALRATSPISVVGTIPSAQPIEAESVYQPYVKEGDPAWYAGQIDSLREEMDQADAEIQTIENIRATGEGITGGVSMDKLSVGVTPEATVEILEGQKSALEEEVEGLQDQGRENYIPAEAWR